jgi:hydroxymethylpyrimidine pyrophosphatase-like HAD family hydrolase
MSSQQTVRPRAIFLDIDGTYADHGLAPEAHVTAVRTARRLGHLVFVCTGRPLSMVPGHILEAGFDGSITGAGARVRSPEGHAIRTGSGPQNCGNAGCT